MRPTAPRAARRIPRRSLLLVVALLLAALPAALHPPPARAATITVTTTADATPPAGACSLRQAIQAANSDMAVDGCLAGAGADTITFAAGVTGTIALATTLPAITSAITIQGPGAAGLTVSGGGTVQLLQVPSGATLTLSGLTLANGRVGFGGFGGAIRNTGSLSITNSTLSGNGAEFGGAIFNQGSLSITNSTLSGNQAGGSGGAIYNQGSVLSITNSTLSGNTATGSEGGSAIFTTGSPSPVELRNSTIAANQSGSAPTLALSNGSASLQNVLLANGVSPNCSAGTLTDQGGNLASDASCLFTQISSKPNTDPLLGPLADNGGPTQTMALLPGSPAIGAAVAPCPPTDQRGVTRPPHYLMAEQNIKGSFIMLSYFNTSILPSCD